MAETTGPTLSVVIPTFNEEAVIAETLTTVARYLEERAVSYELLVANDGSTDRSVAIATGLVASLPHLRVLDGPHRGKGAAVRRGVLAASGQWVLFMDADLATPIEQWEKLAICLANGDDVVIGSRKMPGASIERRQPAWRESLGKVFTWLTNLLLSTSVSDVTCGFKAFRAGPARAIFARQLLDGWGFDAEILFIAGRLGHRVREVPVVWRDHPGTKVRIVRDAARSLGELLSIRLAAWRGSYD